MTKKQKLIKPIRLVVGAKSSSAFYKGTPIAIAELDNGGLQTVEWRVKSKKWISSKISIADVMDAEYISDSLLDELHVKPRDPYKPKFKKYDFRDFKTETNSFVTKFTYDGSLIGNELINGLNNHLRDKKRLKKLPKTNTNTASAKNNINIGFFEKNQKVLFFIILFIVFLVSKSLINKE
jgi:hypothetical protein